MSPILVIADSRGRNIEPFLHSLTNHEVKIAVYPGADIATSISNASSLLKSRPWSQVYILSGICNLTTKDRKTKKISLTFEDTQQLITTFQELLVSAYKSLSSSCDSMQTPCKRIFAPLTGIDLAKYNQTKVDLQQETLNKYVEMVNTEIAAFNRMNNVFTPWTSRIVHHRNRGKYYTHYVKLSQDGCHLTRCVMEYWAQALSEAFVKNS